MNLFLIFLFGLLHNCAIDVNGKSIKSERLDLSNDFEVGL